MIYLKMRCKKILNAMNPKTRIAKNNELLAEQTTKINISQLFVKYKY